MAHRREHAPDLPLAAFDHHQIEARRIRGGIPPDVRDPRRRRAAVVQDDAAGELSERLRRGLAAHGHAILPLVAQGGVQEPMGQGSIVGEEHQTFRVRVETTDGKEAREALR